MKNLLNKLGVVKQAGSGYLAHCPAHQDDKKSLSIGLGDDGRILLHCHAGCETSAILDALGLTMKDLFNDGAAVVGKGKVVTKKYDYRDADGNLLFQVCRTAEKGFFQRRPDGNGGSINGLGDVVPVLYRLPELLASNGKPIYIPEGEKDVDRLHGLGLAATTSPMGAGKWRPEYAEYFTDKDVVVLPDNDKAGCEHAKAVAESLRGKARAVKVLELPDLPEKGDVSDWLDVGGTAEELQRLADEAPEASIYLSNPGATPQPPEPMEPPNLAYERNIIQLFVDSVKSLGLVGEARNAVIIYMAVTSRLFEREQISVVIKGHSSSGKSYTLEIVLKFFLPTTVCVFTAMSEKALVYFNENLSHRTLIIHEATALREGSDSLIDYFIRTLLSEGYIEYYVPVRGEDGRYVTERIKVDGPTNCIITTTKPRIHAENETRLISLGTDDSPEQTAAVMLQLASDDDVVSDLGEWHQLQRWLEQQDNRVSLPFARAVAALIPPVAVRLRRDLRQVFALVKVHAVLHQLNRERDEQGRIIATIADYTAARDLISDIISEGVGKAVSDTVRQTVLAVEELSNENGVPARVVAEHLKIDKSNASRRLRVAAGEGYIMNLETKRGRPGRWTIDAPLPERFELLPQPEDLKSGCAVAAGFETYIDTTAETNKSESVRWEYVADM